MSRSNNAASKRTRLDLMQVVLGLVGIGVMCLAWQFDHGPDTGFLIPIVAPKYDSAMNGYQKLLDLKKETPVNVADDMYVLFEMLRERLAEPSSPITRIFVVKTVGTVVSERGVLVEPELTLEISQADGSKQTLTVSDLQSQIKEKYLDRPFRRGSMWMLIFGILVELMAIFWPAISGATKAST